MASQFERALAVLADVARGKVRSGWDANDRPVTYVASKKATTAQLSTIRTLHLNGRIELGEGGLYKITNEGLTHLNIHYPTWRR